MSHINKYSKLNKCLTGKRQGHRKLAILLQKWHALTKADE